MPILGIDIGGTKAIIAVYTNGGLVGRTRVESQSAATPMDYLDGIKDAARAALRAAGNSKLTGIGIGCGGPLDKKSGSVVAAPNLPGWDNLPLTRIFSEEFGAPAYLDNDATAAALGELVFGAGRGVENFVYFTVSTGIGGGIVIGGKIYRGSDDNAAEFGHHKIVADGPPCTCGDRGCLESFASGKSIARRAKEAALLLDLANRPSWADDLDGLTAERVASEAARGEPLALEVWLDCMTYLGIGVANVVSILNPELVIIGGGVSKAGDLLFEPVRKVAHERAMYPLAENVRIVPAKLGDDVGLMGAVALAMESAAENTG